MPLPNRPADDSNREVHELAIQQAVDDFADMQKAYLDRLYKQTAMYITYWWLGKCTAIDTSAKTATVEADPVEGKGGDLIAPTLVLKWGRERWSEGQIVGKRVRFGWNSIQQYGFIIDTVNNE